MTGLIYNPNVIANVFRSPAEGVDSAFLFILGICIIFFLLTQGLLIYFAIKYRRRKAGEPRKTPYITTNILLETVWIIIPSIVVAAIFAYGYVAFRGMMTPVKGAMEINVTARQWMWEFAYPNGKKAVNELRVPSGKPVTLRMGSEDVIHSLYIPDYRIKRDIVPGSYAVIGFTPGQPGRHHIFCAEYCGAGHSTMNATLIVMKPDKFHEWLEAEGGGGAAIPLAEQGESLYKEYGCNSCHTTDGTKSIGPSFKGIYGKKVRLEDGSTVTADDDYLLESMMDPKAKVVKGFQPVMPTYKGSLSADQRNAIIAYLKNLSGVEEEGGHEGAGHEEAGETSLPDAARGKDLFGKLGCSGCHSVDGSSGAGPTMKGLIGRSVTFSDGSAATADEDYVRESILDPKAKVVKGFQPIMPSFKGAVTEDQIADITAYIKTLK